jgi:hypothetical protein
MAAERCRALHAAAETATGGTAHLPLGVWALLLIPQHHTTVQHV